MEVPGVGPLLASAFVATVADPSAFKTGRDLAAWIGLVPKQNSSGGTEPLGTIVSGSFRSAIFERAARKDYIRVEEGEVLDGWTLAKVSRAGVLLGGGGQELSMKLEAGLR